LLTSYKYCQRREKTRGQVGSSGIACSSLRAVPQYFQTHDVMAPGVRARWLQSTFSPTEQSLITHHTELLTASLNKQHAATCPHFECQSIQSTVRSSPTHSSSHPIKSTVRVSSFSPQFQSVHSVHSSKPVHLVHNPSQSIQCSFSVSPFSPHSQSVNSVHTPSQSIQSTPPASPFSAHSQSVHSVHTPSQSIQSIPPASPFSPYPQPVHSVHTPSQSTQSTLPVSPFSPHLGPPVTTECRTLDTPSNSKGGKKMRKEQWRTDEKGWS